MTRRQRRRLAGVGAVVAAVVVVLVLVLGGGRSYTIHAQFINAGQLVKGDDVQVAGKRIGTISDIRLTQDDLADVVLKIGDGKYQTLHRGTIATIRTVGLASIANRFVDLSPGPQSAPKIPDGGTLSTAETRPIVDLDELLAAVDPKTRNSLRGIIHASSTILPGRTHAANQALHYLNPAASQLSALSAELTRDQPAFQRLVSTSATAVSALASRRADIESGVSTTADVLRALARERGALADTLVRAPAVLRQAGGTLVRVRGTLAAVRPVLRETRPVARPLAQVLRHIVPTARRTIPVVAQVRTLLGPLAQTLLGAPALARAAVPALNASGGASRVATPIINGLTPYNEDLIGGFVNGFGGTTSGYYDANGHYARISALGGASGLVGLAGLIPGIQNASGAGFRQGLTARCPGSAVEPASDASNPWIPDPSVCDPKDNP